VLAQCLDPERGAVETMAGALPHLALSDPA